MFSKKWKGKYHVRYWKREFSGDWNKTKKSIRSKGFEFERDCFEFVELHPIELYCLMVFRDGELIYGY